jgi:acetylornithine/succinyldiaminopimelate/putrescine aminotransferase
MTVMPTAARRLSVGTGDVLAGLSGERTLNYEIDHGNSDLVRLGRILGIAGPFHIVTPWELSDPHGHHVINAGGYSALPFGEMYPPLVSFLRRFLEENRSMGFPQQAAAEWRAALEESLVALLTGVAPSHEDSRLFFSNSGSEAIEAAIKFVRTARPKAKYLINFTRGFHGKTSGALSLTANEEYQAPFRPLLPDVVTLPYGDVEALHEGLRQLRPDRVAGIVLEPIQGEAGVIVPPAEFLPAVERVRQEHGIVVVADEIQSGLGRTGHLFASVDQGLDPDIVTLAKPLGGGMVPIGATIARKWIARKMLGGLACKRHSNTFGGGSLAMAVGLRSLEIIVEEDLVSRSRELGQRGRERLEEIKKKYPHFLQEVRGTGMLFAMQLQRVLPVSAFPAASEVVGQLGSLLAVSTFHKAGLHVCFTLNAGQVVRLSPALTMPEKIFDEMFDRVELAASENPKASKMLRRTPPKNLFKLMKTALA